MKGFSVPGPLCSCHFACWQRRRFYDTPTPRHTTRPPHPAERVASCWLPGNRQPAHSTRHPAHGSWQGRVRAGLGAFRMNADSELSKEGKELSMFVYVCTQCTLEAASNLESGSQDGQAPNAKLKVFAQILINVKEIV